MAPSQAKQRRRVAVHRFALVCMNINVLLRLHNEMLDCARRKFRAHITIERRRIAALLRVAEHVYSRTELKNTHTLMMSNQCKILLS